MTYKGDVPSVQNKLARRRATSMREADDLSLIFVDFYVPMIASRLRRCSSLRTKHSLPSVAYKQV
jgi:hypothetical protein